MYIFFSGDTCHQVEAALTPAVNEQIPRLYYKAVTVVGAFVFDRILEYINITAGAGCHDVCIIFCLPLPPLACCGSGFRRCSSRR